MEKLGEIDLEFSMFALQYSISLETQKRQRFKPDPCLKLKDQECQVLR
jgi:hypothetical protein